jgi:hypothetical protein
LLEIFIGFDDALHLVVDCHLQAFDLVLIRHDIHHGVRSQQGTMVCEKFVVGKVVDVTEKRDHGVWIIFLQNDFFEAALLLLVLAIV